MRVCLPSPTAAGAWGRGETFPGGIVGGGRACKQLTPRAAFRQAPWAWWGWGAHGGQVEGRPGALLWHPDAAPRKGNALWRS